MKYFFETQDSEMCYTKEHFLNEMEDNLTEMEVYPAKMIVGEPFAWCTELETSIETRKDDCGKWCNDYAPRNGKNGRCKHSSNTYEASEIPVTIKQK